MPATRLMTGSSTKRAFLSAASLVVLWMALLLCEGRAWAIGENTGSLGGYVTAKGTKDGLAGIPLSLRSKQLIGGTQQKVTNDDGSFTFVNLPPGTYELSVKMEGFVPYRQLGIVINAPREESAGQGSCEGRQAFVGLVKRDRQADQARCQEVTPPRLLSFSPVATPLRCFAFPSAHCCAGASRLFATCWSSVLAAAGLADCQNQRCHPALHAGPVPPRLSPPAWHPSPSPWLPVSTRCAAGDPTACACR